MRGDVERDELRSGEGEVIGAFEDVRVRRICAAHELGALRRELRVRVGETETTAEIPECEKERALGRSAKERELARRVEAIVEPRLPPRCCETVASIATGNDDPIFGRQIFARERGATCDLDEEWSVLSRREPAVDREIAVVVRRPRQGDR